MNITELAIAKAMIGGGSGGGVSSWNDLTDKPFEEFPPRFEAIEWDGNIDGKEHFFFSKTRDALNPMLCKMRDTYIEKESMIGAKGEVTYYNGNKVTITSTADQFVSASPLGFTDEKTWMMYTDGMPFVLSVHSAENGCSEGVYFLYVEFQVYVSRVYDDVLIKTLEPKYMPDMRINVSTSDGYNCVADKTFDEIIENISNGGIPYCVGYDYSNNRVMVFRLSTSDLPSKARATDQPQKIVFHRIEYANTRIDLWTLEILAGNFCHIYIDTLLNIPT